MTRIEKNKYYSCPSTSQARKPLSGLNFREPPSPLPEAKVISSREHALISTQVALSWGPGPPWVCLPNSFLGPQGIQREAVAGSVALQG